MTVYRDFPEGCGVPSKHLSNADELLMQSKFKVRRRVNQILFEPIYIAATL